MRSPGQLFKAVTAVSFMALMVLSYVDIIFLPQKKTMDEQHAAIARLVREVRSLREERKEDEATRQRVRSLEAAMLRVSPETAKSLGIGKARSPAPPPLPELADAAEPAGGSTEPTELAEPAEPAASEGPSAAPAAGAKGKKQQKKPKATKPADRWRHDDKCGADALTASGKPAECNPDGNFPCCAPSGWCGASAGHCTCQGCVDYRAVRQESALTAEISHYREDSNKTIAIVIPFRDRGVHLERFRERIHSHAEAWNARGIHHTWVVFVVEQFDNALFNRGWLFNAGLKHAQDYAKSTGKLFDCIVMQDIDLLPEPSVDYGWCIWPVQLSGEIECWSWSVPYADNVGGVTSLSPKHWTTINGFSNEYEGWGGEDDDFYLRLKQNQLLKGNCHTWCKDAKKPTVPMVYRPPLGRGRFECLHDGDHTPRQRAHNDAAMWQRLNAMKANSQRWRTDGVSSLSYHSAGPPLWTKACSSCTGPEDPTERPRAVSEMWVRVSSKPISSPERVVVKLRLADVQCSETSRPLTSTPAGLEGLRTTLAGMFGQHCAGNDTSWVHRTSFLLIDVALGQALVVGEGIDLVVPDSSLPEIKARGESPVAEEVPNSKGPVVLGQRLSRWIRKLPEGHVGWLLVEERPAEEVRNTFIDTGRRVPQTAPVCISLTNFEGAKKYRATPGTKWCGDGGWANGEHFQVLRSKQSVPQDTLVPICISYNKQHYTYRFEKSEDGCVGDHEASGTSWKHAHTIHTSKDATGEQLCVGVFVAGPKTRWTMQKRPRCDGGGFRHTFSFSAMADSFRPPLISSCLLVEAHAHGGGHDKGLHRLAPPALCRAPPAEWSKAQDVMLLARRHAPEDVRICTAEGLPEKDEKESSAGKGSRLWRVFRGEACEKAKFTTREGNSRKVHHWSVQQEPQLFVPQHATGVHLCLCWIPRKKALGYYSWYEGECPSTGKQELCFNDLSVSDALNYVHVIDDVT